jgi:hypothetical protein
MVGRAAGVSGSQSGVFQENSTQKNRRFSEVQHSQFPPWSMEKSEITIITLSISYLPYRYSHTPITRRIDRVPVSAYHFVLKQTPCLIYTNSPSYKQLNKNRFLDDSQFRNRRRLPRPPVTEDDDRVACDFCLSVPEWPLPSL